MVEAIGATTLAQMQTNGIGHRLFTHFEFPEGNFGFHTGLGTIVWSGVEFVGAGSLLQIDKITSQSDGTAVGVKIELTSIPNTDLTPDVLGSIFDYTYFGAPVTLYSRFINLETRAPIETLTQWGGYIDKIEEAWVVGGESRLRAYLEGRSRGFTREGYRKHNDADQREIDPNDGSLRHQIVTAREPIYWGRNPPEKAS